MKKFFMIILVAMFVFTMNITSFATTDNFVYEYDNITVIFEENTPFSAEQRENIADVIIYGNSPTTYGLWCTLFGHSYVEDTVTTITHRVRETVPKCLEETFIVGECSRCGETYSNLIKSGYIYCCE